MTIRMCNMGTERDGIGKVIHFKNQNIIGTGFFGKNILALVELEIKGGGKTMKLHDVPKKTPLLLQRQASGAFRELGFLLINVIAPYNHFTD